jgi:hypothetical protein
MIPLKKDLNRKLAEHGGFARFQSNDGWLCGPLDILYPAIAKYEAALLTTLGLESVQHKYAVYVSAPEHDSAARPPVMRLSGAMVHGTWHPGFKPNGVPVSPHSEYARHEVGKIIDQCVSDNNKLCSTLRNRDPHAGWAFLYYCQNAQITHWLQWCYPKDINPHLSLLLASLDEVFAVASGTHDIIAQRLTTGSLHAVPANQYGLVVLAPDQWPMFSPQPFLVQCGQFCHR